MKHIGVLCETIGGQSFKGMPKLLVGSSVGAGLGIHYAHLFDHFIGFCPLFHPQADIISKLPKPLLNQLKAGQDVPLSLPTLEKPFVLTPRHYSETISNPYGSRPVCVTDETRVRLVFGDQDPLVPVPSERELRKLMPHHRKPHVAVLEGQGHNVPENVITEEVGTALWHLRRKVRKSSGNAASTQRPSGAAAKAKRRERD